MFTVLLILTKIYKSAIIVIKQIAATAVFAVKIKVVFCITIAHTARVTTALNAKCVHIAIAVKVFAYMLKFSFHTVTALYNPNTLAAFSLFKRHR